MTNGHLVKVIKLLHNALAPSPTIIDL